MRRTSSSCAPTTSLRVDQRSGRECEHMIFCPWVTPILMLSFFDYCSGEACTMSESTKSAHSTGDQYVDDNEKELVPLAGIDPEDERKAVRRLDYSLLPIMTMFYLLSFLVRETPGCNAIRLDFVIYFCCIAGSVKHRFVDKKFFSEYQLTSKFQEMRELLVFKLT